MERNGLPRRSARHHVLLLISFLFSFSSRCSYHLVLDKTITSSCVRHKTSTDTRSNHDPSRPHFPAPLSFLSLFLTTLRLCSRTLEQCLPTLSCNHAASVRSHLPYFIFPFMHLYALFNLHHRRPRGRLYDTDLIGIAHVQYIRQPSYSSGHRL